MNWRKLVAELLDEVPWYMSMCLLTFVITYHDLTFWYTVFWVGVGAVCWIVLSHWWNNRGHKEYKEKQPW